MKTFTAMSEERMTTAEAAQYLGLSTSWFTGNLVYTGRIPHKVDGRGKIIIKRSDVLAFEREQNRIANENLKWLANESQERNAWT